MAVFRRRPEEKPMDPNVQDPTVGDGVVPQPVVDMITNKDRQTRPNGLPGVQQREDGGVFDPRMQEQLLTQPTTETRITEKDVAKAIEALTEYKNGKQFLERRVVDDELWWELRHWEAIGKRSVQKDCNGNDIVKPRPTSAWLFNSLVSKHADAMDNYPEPIVLPREQSDDNSAKILSEILPVILEQNRFDDTYSDNWWEKLKHGTGCYGVFWDQQKQNGLGDISIQQIDLLKLFWEPGITDLQDSRNIFIVDLVDEDLLNEQYPEFEGKLKGSAVQVKDYIYDETIDTSKKTVVVDWYYKRVNANGKTVLHYCKFVSQNAILYASENDPQYQETGWYEDGEYPIVADTLFPEKGTPIGFGYIAICKDPQLYIDNLSANILQSAAQATKPRYFISANSGVNAQDFMDWEKPLVQVEGELDEARVRKIETGGLNNVWIEVMNQKIDEMKETASNRDVNSGGTSSSVTAAAAISALQEAGNKTSRDMMRASYRAYNQIIKMVIERVRQFYDEARTFRIIGEDGKQKFVVLDNSQLRDQPMPPAYNGEELLPDYEQMVRQPIFDIKIKAQKTSPFSRMEQNQRASELYQMGFFNPDRAQEALNCLDMMDFEGIEKVKDKVRQGQTLLNIVQQMNQQMQQMAMMIQQLTGQAIAPQQGQPQGQPQQAQGQTQSVPGGKNNVDRAVTNAAKTNMSSYQQKLAARSNPSLDGNQGQATAVKQS